MTTFCVAPVLTVNYARALVRKLASYLFPEPVTFAVPPAGSAAVARERARRAEEALARVYADNDLAAVDFNAAIDAAVLGDGAFKVTWDAVEGRPVVTAVDVQPLSAWWDADDPRRVTRVVQRTVLPAEEARARYGDRGLAAGHAERRRPLHADGGGRGGA